MSKSLLYIFDNIQSLCILLSFIISLRLVNNDKIPSYMKGFFWYPTIGTIVMIPWAIGKNFFMGLEIFGKMINNISLLFHFSFLSFFIYRVMPQKNIWSNFFRITFVIFFCLLLFTLSKDNLWQINKLSFAIANFGLSVFCIAYYYQIFNNIPSLNLRKEPSFWIISGVFFCMSVHIPMYSSINYLRPKISINSYWLLSSISTFCYTVMHLFFIKAYLCATHPQKV